jgi:hypothetical protein
MNDRHPGRLLAILLAALLCLALLVPRPLAAHGGGLLQLAGEPAGAYRISVWTNPPEPAAGAPIHVTVGVARAADGGPELEADVTVSLVDAASGQMVVTAPATTAASSNRLFYEVDLEVAEVGLYTFVIAVAGPEDDVAVSFDLPIRPPAPPNWWLLGGGALVALAAVVLLARFRSRGRGRPARRQPARPRQISSG